MEEQYKVERCHCDNGTWFAECCSGANGCDCHGQQINMGTCNVCKGSGLIDETSDRRANIKTIQGRCFIGRGPTSGFWAGR